MFLYIFVGITKLPMWKLLSVQTYLYLQNMLSLQFCNISILDTRQLWNYPETRNFLYRFKAQI